MNILIYLCFRLFFSSFCSRNDLNMDNLENEWRTRQIRTEIVKGHPMYFV